MVTLKKNTHLTKFGFRFNRGGAHLSRTMMLEELSSLLAYQSPNADKKAYLNAIKAENCLGKRSGKTRELTSRHIVGLYSLYTADILFRTLLFFWHRDLAGRPLLALLCACARDSILRATIPFILNLPEESVVTQEVMAGHIDDIEPGRFSPATFRAVSKKSAYP